MNQYTKGEWEARKLFPDRHGIITKEAWEITTPEYDVVASINHSAPIRKEDDAHLIAAAPDMYEALKECLVNLEILYRAGNLPKSALHLRAEKALSKAEGK